MSDLMEGIVDQVISSILKHKRKELTEIVEAAAINYIKSKQFRMQLEANVACWLDSEIEDNPEDFIGDDVINKGLAAAMKVMAAEIENKEEQRLRKKLDRAKPRIGERKNEPTEECNLSLLPRA